MGGCSSINGMIYMRGQRQDYEDWARITGDPNWGWEPSLERFKQFEDHYGGANEFHGSGGEWRVSKQRLRWKILDVFMEACQEHGIPATSDFNQGNNFGVAYFDVNQTDGWRLNAATAFLNQTVRSRPNLTIMTHAIVNKLGFIPGTNKCNEILFYQDRERKSIQTGMILQNDPSRFQAFAASVKGEVVLCGGAIGTVQILERSGIGQVERLNHLQIPIIASSPKLGYFCY
jgi:choline dehydrogenase